MPSGRGSQSRQGWGLRLLSLGSKQGIAWAESGAWGDLSRDNKKSLEAEKDLNPASLHHKGKLKTRRHGGKGRAPDQNE